MRTILVMLGLLLSGWLFAVPVLRDQRFAVRDNSRRDLEELDGIHKSSGGARQWRQCATGFYSPPILAALAAAVELTVSIIDTWIYANRKDAKIVRSTTSMIMVAHHECDAAPVAPTGTGQTAAFRGRARGTDPSADPLPRHGRDTHHDCFLGFGTRRQTSQSARADQIQSRPLI